MVVAFAMRVVVGVGMLVGCETLSIVDVKLMRGLFVVLAFVIADVRWTVCVVLAFGIVPVVAVAIGRVVADRIRWDACVTRRHVPGVVGRRLGRRSMFAFGYRCATMRLRGCMFRPIVWATIRLSIVTGFRCR